MIELIAALRKIRQCEGEVAAQLVLETFIAQQLAAMTAERDAAIKRAEAAEKDAGPTAYECPKGCGCWWRDNRNGTMSLFDGDQKSCAICENLPLSKLIRVSLADHLFIDERSNGAWLVCVGKVHNSEKQAFDSCEKWKKIYSINAAMKEG